MLKELRPALVMIVLFTLLTGLAYPLLIAGVGRLLFPEEAAGSLITRNGKVLGSSLIGQNFKTAAYFHGRPSATSAPDPADASKSVDAPYNAGNSGGSNLGPTSEKLIERVRRDVAALRSGGLVGPIPADAVTTSASGLDPDISPDFARAQIPTVAASRDLPQDQIARLVADQIEAGLVGEPRVNVLKLNLALDQATANGH